MSAMHGLAKLFRRRTAIVGVCIVAVLALSAVFSSASNAMVPVSSQYLALGDSISFGYSQKLFNENFPTESPKAFEKGVINKWWAKHKPRENGIGLVNDACPGETTDSLIGNGPLGAALDPETGESACAYHKAGFPLHHEYGAGQSQLESALETIAVGALSGKPVTKVTLNIGANDQLHALKKCEEKAAKEVEEEVAKRIEKEIGEKLAKEEMTPEEIPAVSAQLAKEEKENPANAAAGKEKFLICVVGVAPALGHHIGENIGKILYVLRNGSAFGGVNYEGPVEFLGAYDPYGALITPGVELVPSSNNLVSLFNGGFSVVVGEAGGCFADSHPKFNPQNQHEPEKLQKWTEMLHEDIHPTPAGYGVLASLLFKTCG
jgi:lysophospholipase L1-like esterase